MCVPRTHCKDSVFYLIHQTLRKLFLPQNLPGKCKALKTSLFTW
nr:MAG TPA: hypothetical protein [Bacteriophage sp.]